MAYTSSHTVYLLISICIHKCACVVVVFELPQAPEDDPQKR